MNNSDMPASPIVNSTGGVTDLTGGDQGYYLQEGRSFAFGLTKREHFAGIAMAALINKDGRDGESYIMDSDLIGDAVSYADALLKELSK